MHEMTGSRNLELRRLERNFHDECCLCNAKFREGDTSHSGYAEDGTPLYVGDCCKEKLKTTALRNYWTPFPYAVPKPDSVLWRYMDFPKFVSLLKDEALYFSRLDSLGDKFEGAKGLAHKKDEWDKFYLDFFRKALLNPPLPVNNSHTPEEIDNAAKNLLSQLENSGKFNLKTRYVNCWHQNEVESEAFWRVYAPPNSPGIAIKTTYSDLNDSLGDDPDIQIGRVKYINFSKGFAGINDSVFRKRASLSYENEVRAVIIDHEHSEELGIKVSVKLPLLLRVVVVSPFAPIWFEDVLRETMSRFNINSTIAKSELLLEPFY